MNKDKISSQDIVDLLAAKASVSKRVAEDFLKLFFANIEDALLAGETIKVKNFGTFKLQWNEARKSVNVRTGEDIIINAYPKVVFTPDTQLKEKINEPFAHLEPVVLGEDGAPLAPIEEIVTMDEAALEPLQIFTEQASEIKSIISEIKAMSGKKDLKPETNATTSNEEPVEETIQEQKPSEPEEPVRNPSTATEDVSVEAIHQMLADAEEQKQNSSENESPKEEYASSSQYLKNESEEKTDKESKNKKKKDKKDKPKKKKSKFAWILMAVILLLGASLTGSYFIFEPVKNFANKTFDEFRASEINTTLYNTLTYWNSSIYAWFEPTEPQESPEPKAVLADTTAVADTIKAVVAAPVDSLQLLFDSVRVYTEFIASERIQKGSRLARMSERYYGKSDFWVYIYEANKENIPNPDNIQIGTLIRIPKLDSRLIDINNPRCMEKAIQLHDLYVPKKN